jgi:PTH1 family peptidyl-tRNA hydrolase
VSEQALLRLVVGLGNPERRYELTRHNVGFMVLEELLRRHAFGRSKAKFHGRCWTGSLAGRPVLLLAPQTYMNRSGLAVAQCAGFYRLAPESLLVVMDDMALPLGRLRARAGGSAGGHKGLGDIIAALGAQQVPRLRVGIGQPAPGAAAVQHVLDEFGSDQRPVIAEAIARAAAAVEDWIAHGITYVMDRYNRDTPGVGNQDGQDE